MRNSHFVTPTGHATQHRIEYFCIFIGGCSLRYSYIQNNLHFGNDMLMTKHAHKVRQG